MPNHRTVNTPPSKKKDLLLNYLKIATRTLQRNKSYSFICIFGLAVGIASSMLILLWVQYECSYDEFATNNKNIYQVKVNLSTDGKINTDEGNCMPTYMALKSTDARIKNTCVTTTTYGHGILFQNKAFNKEVLAVSKEFLSMFGIPMISGSASSLDEPYTIVLGESTAKEIFGENDPLNQYILYDNKTELKVTGIFKDIPGNSTFWFHGLTTMAVYFETDKWSALNEDKWDNFYYRIYAELPPQSPVDEINSRIKDIVKPHFNNGFNPELFLHAMDRWYLYNRFENGKEAGGKIDFVRLFGAAGILTLLIAIINYTNLAIARAEKRAKEIGVRKGLGSSRWSLIFQFLFESILVTGVAFCMALILVMLALPSYNLLIGKNLALDFYAWLFWVGGGGIILLTGLLAGAYPALYFSSLQPVKILKGQRITGKREAISGKVLVVFQYVFSISLVIGMMVIHKQIQHVKGRELGYDQENLICIASNEGINKNYYAIKNELLNSGVVESVTKSNQGVDVEYFKDYVEWNEKHGKQKTSFSRISTEYDYTKTMGIELVSGRDFSPEFTSDSSAVLINQTAAKIMHLKDPIGERIRIQDKMYTVIGVIKDVIVSPFDPAAAMYLGMFRDWDNHLTIRLSKTENIRQSLDKVNNIFKKLDPQNVDEIQFVDERYTDNYKSIEQVGKLTDLFALLAIFLTGLGVFGLAAFTAEQRMKELAIRKVLGASTNSLVLLLSRYFTNAAIVSCLIAGPLSWWALDNYLENYSYRISIPWWTIPTTMLGILLITLLIVSSQVVRSSSVNPVNNLRNG